MPDPYTIRLSGEPSYVEVVFHSDMRKEVSLAAVREMKPIGAQAGVDRYLFDVSAVGTHDTRGDQYLFVETVIAEQLIDASDRIAVVVAPLSLEHDFVEMAMQDRGFTYQYFRARDSAIAWLDAG